MDSQQGQVQRLAVSDRARRDQSLHTVVEGDQRCAVGGLQLIDDVSGAAHCFGQRRPGHRAGTVDDQSEMIGPTFHLRRRLGIGRLDADEDRQRLADAGDEGGFEQLDEEPGDVVDMESPVRPAPLPADDCRIAAGRFTG